MEAAAQMLHQRLSLRFIIVERHIFMQDGQIARFFDICRHAEDKPQRIIVKTGADIKIGQRLVSG